MATLALKSRLLGLVCFDHILQRPPPQKRLDGALVPGQGLWRKHSWGLLVLLGLGNEQGISEEEEVPLPCCAALGHSHALMEQRLRWCGNGCSVLYGAGAIPAELSEQCMRKVAAAGLGCARVPQNTVGAAPKHLELQQQFNRPTLLRAREASCETCWWGTGYCPAGMSKAAKEGPSAGQCCSAKALLFPAREVG